jgi:hypothetical protein
VAQNKSPSGSEYRADRLIATAVKNEVVLFSAEDGYRQGCKYHAEYTKVFDVEAES